MMTSRSYLTLGIFALTLAIVALPPLSNAQTAQTMSVKRTTVPNFIGDSMVFFGQEKKPNLGSVFILAANQTGQMLFWSPEVCRLISVRNGDKTDYLELNAEGSHPFVQCLGTMGKPKFFGFRVLDGGIPQFLYTYGQLSIEERFELSNDGSQLKQYFKINSGAISGQLAFPKAWRDIMTANIGSWNDKNEIKFTEAQLKNEIVFTYYLDPDSPKNSSTND